MNGAGHLITRRVRATASTLVVSASVLTAGCSNSKSPVAPPTTVAATPISPAPPIPPAPIVNPVALRISGPAGVHCCDTNSATVQYTAIATTADGAEVDATAQVAWSSAQPAVLQPTNRRPGEMMRGVPGNANLTARLSNTLVDGLGVQVMASGTFGVTGVVRAAGAGPLAETAVRLTRGNAPPFNRYSYTRESGRYAFYGVDAGDIELSVAVEGFSPAVVSVFVDRDTTFDITLDPLSEPVDISGQWSIALSASGACRDNLPEVARERQFDAVVTQQSAQVRILLTGPAIEANSVRLDQFESWGYIRDGRLTFTIVGDTGYGTWSYPDLFQRVTSTQRVGVDGVIEHADVTPNEIRGTMSGFVEWFDSNVKAAPPDFAPAGVCRATDHRIVFRRQ